MKKKDKYVIRIDNAVIIYAFVVALPFSWAAVTIGSVYRALTLLLFCLFLVKSKFTIRFKIENHKVFLSWAFYLIYAISTMIWATNRQAAFNNSMSLVLLGMIVLVFFSVKLNQRESCNVDKCWILAGIICIVLYVFGDKTAVGEYGSRTSMMVMGTATDPNEFASVFIVPLSLILYELLNKKGKRRILGIVVMLMAIYCVLMSGSRGALAATILAVMITLVQSGRVNIKSILIAIIIGIVAMAIVIRYVVPMIPTDVLARMSVKALLQDGGSGRGDLWSDAIRKIWSGSGLRMIFGYGQYGLIVGTKGVSETMHNQFIQQLSNYGLIGLGLYLVLIYNSYKAIKKKCPRYMGAFLGMMLMSLTITMSVAYKLLWILLLMPIVMDKEKRDNVG